MVFATDFDPFEQSQRRRTSAPSKADLTLTADSGDDQDLPVAVRQHRQPSAVPSASQAQRISRPMKRSDAEARRRATEKAIADFEHDASVARQHDSQRQDNVLPVGAASTKPLSFPKKPNLPFGLTLLNRLQQGSAVVTTLLIGSALVLYGSTVYVDKSTSRALVQLDALQSESQQLTTANEAIKQSLAEQATREDSGLELYESGDVLFLAPEPRRASQPVPEEKAERLQPLGY